MNVGANDKKKLGFLIALGLLAAYLVYTNLLAGPETTSSETPKRAAAPASAAPAIPVPTAQPTAQTTAPRSPNPRSRTEEFHPVLHSRRPEDRINPFDVDPTLRLDLFARVQSVDQAGGSRNLFQFSTPPPKEPPPQLKGPEPKVKPGPVQTAEVKPPGPPPPAVEPPPPPVPLKFYGYATFRRNGRKTAYFLDGEEIVIAAEGDVVKRRYRIVRIGPNSVTVEDTDAKRQQTVPLVEESQG
jgi:hypothetical protein